MVAGPQFLVTEVSCGCRQQYYLDLHSLIAQAAAPRVRAGAAGCMSRRCRQICQSARERMLESLTVLGVSRRPHELSAMDALKRLLMAAVIFS